MKLRFKYACKGHWLWRWPLGRSNAKVLHPFILFAAPRKDVSDKLFRHEMEHVYQIMRDGWWTFYIKWLWHTYKLGYLDNPYEIKARTAAEMPLTATERNFKGL